MIDSMQRPTAPSIPSEPADPQPRWWAPVPGLALCLVAAAAGLLVNREVPQVSALIVAIIIGVALTNTVTLPAVLSPGIAVAAKKLLRLGIVMLGLKVVLGDILGLGAPMLAVVVCVVVGGIFGTIAMGRLMGMPPTQVLLIACGFSICGAAAVVGVEGVTEAEEEDVVTAVGLVVIFGTLMIPLIPLLGTLLGMGAETNGLWAGASIHEIAQVVAAGGVIGGGALSVAVIVKLARVLMLAPVVAVLNLRLRRRQDAAAAGGAESAGAKRPPIVPLFVIGFLAMVVLRSSIDLPVLLLDAGDLAQTVLLSAAMFALGLGVKFRDLAKVGVRPFVLAAAATVLVGAISLGGIEIAQTIG